jgi:antitoxin VapB
MLAKVFKSGNSQAVRLPKEFRFNVSEIEIFKRGDEVVLKQKPANIAKAFDILKQLNSSEGVFDEKRVDDMPQDREQF